MRRAPVVATVLAVLSIGIFVVAAITNAGPDVSATLVFGGATASFVLVGALLMARVPGHRLGFLLMLAGALLAIAYGLDAYGVAGVVMTPPWPAAAAAAVIGDLLFVYPIVIALIGIPLVFPDGHLISGRWRWIVALTLVAVVAQSIASLVSTSAGPEGGPGNPFAVPALEPLAQLLSGFASVFSIVGFGAAAGALWVRYRRGDDVERQQLKWLVAVAALAAIFFPMAFMVPVLDIANAAFLAGSLTLIAMPLAIGIAVLRYHLFEIDRIVSRTIAYAVVSALLAAMFVATIVAVQFLLAPLTDGQTIPVAASTLVVCATFQPILRRVKRLVDRRFDRGRYDADRTALAFSERLRGEVDIAAVTGDLEATVQAAVRPTTLDLWVRRSAR